MALLELDGDDALIASLIVERAQQLQMERLENLVKAIGAHVGNHVARILARAFR